MNIHHLSKCFFFFFNYINFRTPVNKIINLMLHINKACLVHIFNELDSIITTSSFYYVYFDWLLSSYELKRKNKLNSCCVFSSLLWRDIYTIHKKKIYFTNKLLLHRIESIIHDGQIIVIERLTCVWPLYNLYKSFTAFKKNWCTHMKMQRHIFGVSFWPSGLFWKTLFTPYA